MDKTTNWLIRGASLIAIIAGINFLGKPYIERFINYYSSDEDGKAELRCKNFPKLSIEEFFKKLSKNEIKKGFYTPTYFQVNTISGEYIIEEPLQVMWYLDKYNIAVSGYNAFLNNDIKNKILIENYKLICR